MIFNDFLRNFAQCDTWMNFVNTNKKEVERARFGNEERILRFFAMLHKWKVYSGNLASFLNSYMESVRNLSSNEIDEFNSILLKTIKIASLLAIPLHIQKNKNLIEAVLVGIASNISLVEKLSQAELENRFNLLLHTKPFSDDIREGMAHTVKVKERIESAVLVWR